MYVDKYFKQKTSMFFKISSEKHIIYIFSSLSDQERPNNPKNNNSPSSQLVSLGKICLKTTAISHIKRLIMYY